LKQNNKHTNDIVTISWVKFRYGFNSLIINSLYVAYTE
jgi:hypothetical protein